MGHGVHEDEASRKSCLTETEMSAFADGRPLRERSRGSMVAHVAECEECRMLLSALVKSGSMAAPHAGTPYLATEYDSSREKPGSQTVQIAASLPAPVRHPLTSELQALIGQTVAGKYRIDSVLGVGGMGVVLSAHHLGLGQSFAIKFLHGDAAKTDEGRARFLREARAAAQLRGDHVIRVIDTGTHPSAHGSTPESGSGSGSGEAALPYLVMELLEGQSLQSLIRSTSEARAPLPLATVATYMLQTAEALAEAHRAGIVHRDLKPDNLFVKKSADGTQSIKVVDFGISKVDDEVGLSLTSQNAVMGTPRYMAPEQMRNAKDVDARADIWALGAILYELLSGAPPFDAATLTELITKVQLEPHTPLASRAPQLPASLSDLVDACLAKDRSLRLSDTQAFATALMPFAPASARVHLERIERLLGRAPSLTPPMHPAAVTASLPWVASSQSQPPPSVTAAQNATAQGSKSSVSLLLALGCMLVGAGLLGALTWVWTQKAPSSNKAGASVSAPSEGAPHAHSAPSSEVLPPIPALAATTGPSITRHTSATVGTTQPTGSTTRPASKPSAASTADSDPHGLRTRN
jgi:eukaryotic-like serine/threonine-protein kinase